MNVFSSAPIRPRECIRILLKYFGYTGTPKKPRIILFRSGGRGTAISGSRPTMMVSLWWRVIRSRGENRAVGEQKSGTYFKGSVILSTAIGRRIPQLHQRGAGNGPVPTGGIIEF